jgi:hypothetical protein
MFPAKSGDSKTMRPIAFAAQAAVLALAAASLSGCLATAAVGAAGTVAATAVGVTTKAAAETVHVGHVAVNAATGSGGNKDGGK